MKKVTSIIFALMFCIASTLPAMAETTYFSNGETIPSGTYDEIYINSASDVKITGDVIINGRLYIGKNSNLSSSGTLRGNDITYGKSSSANNKLGGSKFDITFSKDYYAENFFSDIGGNGFIDENRVMSCKHNCAFNNFKCTNCGYECHHKKWNNGVCTVCKYECPHEGIVCDNCGKEIVLGLTASTFSEGNMTIVIGIAALVLGIVVGFFLGKKIKQPEE